MKCDKRVSSDLPNLDILFEDSLVLEPLAPHDCRCYVGTATGKLIQLSYNDRTVQAVFDLHSEVRHAFRVGFEAVSYTHLTLPTILLV
eukprot:3319207-Amphidinium_carterae.1